MCGSFQPFVEHQYAYSPNCSLYISKSTDKEFAEKTRAS